MHHAEDHIELQERNNHYKRRLSIGRKRVINLALIRVTLHVKLISISGKSMPILFISSGPDAVRFLTWSVSNSKVLTIFGLNISFLYLEDPSAIVGIF